LHFTSKFRIEGAFPQSFSNEIKDLGVLFDLEKAKNMF